MAAPLSGIPSFNLKREASPLATCRVFSHNGKHRRFQSQARSQSPSDGTQARRQPNLLLSFNLKREASPLATGQKGNDYGFLHSVSISSEKPVP